MGESASTMACVLREEESQKRRALMKLSLSNHTDTHPIGSQISDTLIIYDWDDTLLCSSAINSAQWSLRQLQVLEESVEALLEVSMRLGETLIVTNGNSNWVQESCQRYLPGLLPTLAHIRSVSARANYEHQHPGDPFAWKRRTFKELLGKWQSNHWNPGVNLLVIGDSTYEIEAAQVASRTLSPSSLVKTVKLKEAPSVTELLGQQQKVSQALQDIVSEAQSANRVLVHRQSPGDLQSVHSWSLGWQIVDASEVCSWGSPSSWLQATHEESLASTLPGWALLLGEQLVCGNHEMQWCRAPRFDDLDEEDTNGMASNRIAPVPLTWVG